MSIIYGDDGARVRHTQNFFRNFLVIVYRLSSSLRLAGLRPENIVYYYSLSSEFESQASGFKARKCILIWLKAEAW